MEFDLALISLPAFTQKCPSLGLASLTTYLTQQNYKIITNDYGVHFFENHLKKFHIQNPLIKELRLSPYALWGISNWLAHDDVINPKDGYFLIKSLCPVCSELYLPIFDEFTKQISLTHQIVDSYIQELVALDTCAYGFSLLLGNAPLSLYVIQRLKEIKPNATIVVGGPDASLFYRAEFYAHNTNIDYVIYHPEGEIPLKQILKYLKGEITKSNIPGIYSKVNNHLIKSEPPPLFDINKTPVPDFSLLEDTFSLTKLTSLDILISKGCPYNCSFCNEPYIWGKYRQKSVNKIVEEIKYYINNYSLSSFDLGDNSFSSSSTFQKALEKLFADGISINWGGNCRVNELNRKRIQDLHHLGLSYCFFGIESASPKVLNFMNKNINLVDLRKLLHECTENEIKTFLYFMVGFPGETSQDFHKTLEFIKTNSKNIHNVTSSVFTLMMGSPIFQSDLLVPIPGPKILNAFTYRTKDGVSHEERKTRFLEIQELKNRFFT